MNSYAHVTFRKFLQKAGRLFLAEMFVWLVVFLAVVLLYRLARFHLWLIFGSASGSQNPFQKAAR